MRLFFYDAFLRANGSGVQDPDSSGSCSQVDRESVDVHVVHYQPEADYQKEVEELAAVGHNLHVVLVRYWSWSMPEAHLEHGEPCCAVASRKDYRLTTS